MSVQLRTKRDVIRETTLDELVTTHVFHVVDEECSQPGSVRTMCGYYLYEHQYDDRQNFDEVPTTTNQLCHHCSREIRARLEENDD